MRWTAIQRALTTPRRALTGHPQSASIPHVFYTLRRCCKTAWSWLQGEWIAISILQRAPSWDMVFPRIHWNGSRKLPSRSLNKAAICNLFLSLMEAVCRRTLDERQPRFLSIPYPKISVKNYMSAKAPSMPQRIARQELFHLGCAVRVV